MLCFIDLAGVLLDFLIGLSVATCASAFAFQTINQLFNHVGGAKLNVGIQKYEILRRRIRGDVNKFIPSPAFSGQVDLVYFSRYVWFLPKRSQRIDLRAPTFDLYTHLVRKLPGCARFAIPTLRPVEK